MRSAPETCRGGRRPGFTLTEMLLVVVIISIVASLVTYASIQALNRSKEAATTVEIDQMASAIENFKAKFGAYPPGAGTLYRDPGDPPNTISETPAQSRARVMAFVSRAFSQYSATIYWDDTGAAVQQGTLRDTIGRATLFAPNWAASPLDPSNDPSFSPATPNCCDLNTLDAAEALVFWLGGLPRQSIGSGNGQAFELTRFNADPTNPFAADVSYASGGADAGWGNTRTRTERIGEFDPTRLVDADADGWPEYSPANMGGEAVRGKYVYFEASTYAAQPCYPDLSNPNDPTLAAQGNLQPLIGFAKPFARTIRNAADPSFNANDRTTWSINWVEPDRFQIVAAGADRAFSESTEPRDMLRLYPSGDRLSASTGTSTKVLDTPVEDNLSSFYAGRLENEVPKP